MKRVAYYLAVATLALFAFSHSAYADFVKLPARGVNEGTEFTVGCGDGKVLIGLRGKMSMFFGKLEGLCRPLSTEGQWLGSTSSTAESGGAGGIYPLLPQPFSITCPEDTVVKGMSGRFDGFVVRVTLNCFSHAPVASGIGVTRTISAPLHAGDSTSWSEDRCPDNKPGRGFHGKFTTAGVRSIGLVCHSGQSPDLEILAAPNNVTAMNLATPTGPQASTVTPFIQVQWRDQSTYETGFRLVFARMDGGAGRTIDRPAVTGTGSLQALNVVDLPGGGYLFQVCSKYPPSDSPNRCSLPMVLVSVALAATCSPTIDTVFRSGAGQAVVRWTHTCANPIRFEVQLKTGNGNFINTLLPPNGSAREHSFQFVDGANHEVRVCPVFQGQPVTAFCSAPRAFRFELNG